MNATLERIKDWLSAHRYAAAGILFSVNGIIMVLAGLLAFGASFQAFQGEALLLFVGGLALILFGVMTVVRWGLFAVRTGLVGMTAAYFASALSEFEVATDPCDIGSTMERCAGHVPGGQPWAVYEEPLLLAILLFFFLALEPIVSARAKGAGERS